MRFNLWLAQPETERKLATTLRIAAIGFACWALACAYGLWSTRSALAATRMSVTSQRKKISETAASLPSRRREAARANSVKIASGDGTASADFTNELAQIAEAVGVHMAGVRVGDGKLDQSVAQASSAHVSAKSTASVPTSSSIDDGWAQEPFECNVAGTYVGLTKFLSLLAASRDVVDITALDTTVSGSKTDLDGPHLEMKLNGIIYEASQQQ